MLDYYACFFPEKTGRGADRRTRIERSLARVGLSEQRDVQLRRFSKGMLQRLGLAQAIIHDPQVVILDEPMSGLDPVGRREVRDLILELKKEGRTVFFSTHILPDAETLCDRVAVLARGKLRGVGSATELFERHVEGVEIVFEMPGDKLPVGLSGNVTQTGDRFCWSVPVDTVYESFDQLRKIGARVVGCTEIRPTLEEYFMRMVEGAK